MRLGSLTGQLAALGAAACWALTALIFEAAGRRIGALSLNLLRLTLALAAMLPTVWLTTGNPLPLAASPRSWLWLSVSGIAGFVVGDLCLIKALVEVGPRLSTLLMSLVPLLAALLGRLFLGERLPQLALLGIALTVGGIGMAVLARHPEVEEGRPRHNRKGIALGLGGAFGQACGLVLSKLGMGALNPFAATEIRLVAGVAGFSLLFVVLRWWPQVRQAVRDRRAMGFTALGAFFGPYLGVSLSLVAVRAIPAGIAASLMATTPILVLPLIVWLRRERVGFGAVVGTLVAVGGVVLLFL